MSFISPTWQAWANRIDEQIRTRGIENWRDFDEIRRNITLSDVEHYRRYAQQCADGLWPNNSTPHIIEIGAGYGGMAPFWPKGAVVDNVDLPPMLRIQQHWLETAEQPASVQFCSINSFVDLPVTGAYLFSAFGLTETTLALWEHCLRSVFPRLAGIGLIGSWGWSEDGPSAWPWEETKAIFDVVHWHEFSPGGVPGVEFFGQGKHERAPA
jgi:hypothetical protein